MTAADPEYQRQLGCARAALIHMEKRHVPPTPDNFTVWFGYVAGSQPALKRAIDILTSNRQEFTPEVCADLFERFYGSHKQTERVRQITQQIEAVVSKALGTLTIAGEEARHYGETLGETANALSTDTEINRVRDILRQVMDETQDMIQRSDQLERQLNRSTEEIGELRKQVEDASREAMTDALTGIGNRKHFDMRLKAFMHEAMEQGGELSLLLLDIDHFKKFNDTYGHQFGDLVLRLVAKVLVDGIKGRDQAARYGGEEFAILLPDTKLIDATKVAEHLRETIASRSVIKKDTREQLGTVTISIGVSTYRLGEPPYVFIERADTALYKAKQSGRNCIVTEESGEPLRSIAEAAVISTEH